MAGGLTLVLGATGSFGGGMARELLRRGRGLRVLVRDPAKLRARLGDAPGLEAVSGDAEDAGALARAAEGAGAIVHGVNFPYHRWVPHMERVTANVIAAARGQGATILFPGNVYGLGAQTDRPLAETAAMRPDSRKGALRVKLEEDLRAATVDGGARAIVLRAGDYFGPTVRNGLVDPIFGNAARGRPMLALGRLDVPHQWAFVPDLARIGADLLELSERLEPFEIVHFKGHVVDPERDFLALVAQQAGQSWIRIRRAPWWLVRLMGLFDPQARELVELRYLFDRAVVLDDPRRRALLPAFRPTPLDEAVRETVDSYRRGSAPVSGRA